MMSRLNTTLAAEAYETAHLELLPSHDGQTLPQIYHCIIGERYIIKMSSFVGYIVLIKRVRSWKIICRDCLLIFIENKIICRVF